MTVRAYIATEGPHDVELLAGLLRPWGIRRVQKLSNVDPFWKRLIPKTFPHDDDLLKRMPVPTFFASETHSVALDAAVGIDKLAARVEESLSILDATPATAAVLDADDGEPVARRHAELAVKLQKLGLPLPARPGEISAESPRCGIYVLPDNATAGTLETLLEECAVVSYGALLTHARGYVAGIDSLGMAASELRELRKPAGRSKATIAAMAAILRPGRAIQVSLQDNNWLRGAALELPRVLAVRDFLADLLELPRPSTTPGSAP